MTLCQPTLDCRCPECSIDRVAWASLGFLAKCDMLHRVQAWTRSRRKLRFMGVALLEGLAEL